MKKTFLYPSKLWLLVAGFSVFIACSEDPVEDNPVLPQAQQGYAADEEFYIDEETAQQIAQRLNLDDPYNVEEPNKEKRAIGQFMAVPHKGPASYYIVNYEKGGYAVISADKRNVPILAYSEKHSVGTGEVPGGIVDQFEEYHEYTQHLRDSLKYVPEEIKEMWYGFTDKKAYEKMRQSGNQRLLYTTTVGPLLSTNWGQGCAYNNLLSACRTGGSCRQVWTGCVATATAQVMRYHQQPRRYNWSAMPSSRTWDDGTTDLDRVMRDVGQNIGMNYGCDGSGAWPNDAANSLRSDFGYESANYRSSFSWKEYRSELYSRFPVMLVGYNEKNESCFLWWCSTSYSGGHAWVGDGYRYRRYSSGNEYRYAHMNWGWDGSSNGWYYLTGSWNSFKYKKQMVTDIRP